jgi:hypothetical protein
LVDFVALIHPTPWLKDDLRDRDDLLDRDDANAADRGDECGEATVGEAIDRMNKNLVVARKQLDAARASLVGTDKAEELVSTETDGDVAAQAEVRVASAIAGNGLWHRPLPLTAIPAALAWPPPTAAAHDPPR